MPFPDNMVFCRFEFNWQPAGEAAPIEIQDTGIWGRFPVPGGASFPDWQDLVDDFAAQAAAAWTDNWQANLFSNAVKLARVVVYHYDQAHANILHRGEAGPVSGNAWAGTGAVMPAENTIVLTLQTYAPGTFQSQAARHRGRMYMPTLSQAMVGPDGRLPVASANDYVEKAQAFFTDLTDDLDDVHFVPMVNSVTGQMANAITHLRVGRVVDTQRRRRNKLQEQYSVGTLTG